MGGCPQAHVPAAPDDTLNTSPGSAPGHQQPFHAPACASVAKSEKFPLAETLCIRYTLAMTHHSWGGVDSMTMTDPTRGELVLVLLNQGHTARQVRIAATKRPYLPQDGPPPAQATRHNTAQRPASWPVSRQTIPCRRVCAHAQHPPSSAPGQQPPCRAALPAGNAGHAVPTTPGLSGSPLRASRPTRVSLAEAPLLARPGQRGTAWATGHCRLTMSDTRQAQSNVANANEGCAPARAVRSAGARAGGRNVHSSWKKPGRCLHKNQHLHHKHARLE